MAEKIIMPKAGMAMEYGTIIAWLKEIGDPVSTGEPLLEIETDKTSMQVESMNDGYLLKKLFDAGEQIPVVTTIGYIGEKDETVPEYELQSTAEQSAFVSENTEHAVNTALDSNNKDDRYIPATPLARTRAQQIGVKLSEITPDGIIRSKDVENYKNKASLNVKTTPLASRIAGIKGIDLQTVTGSGLGGKIYSADLTVPVNGSRERPAAVERISLNAMRKTIAARMLQSHMKIPPVTLNSEADVTRLWALRHELNDCANTHISFNDFVIRAAVIALLEFPTVNSSFEGDAIRRHESINIGIAVALDQGLIVPILHNADSYTLRRLSKKARDLAVRARENSLKAEEYSGGTFTISNLGMFGITGFTPIINLPEACILGVCAIRDKVVLSESGTVSSLKYMGLSLTFDHRCLDGAESAKFLKRIVTLLENPLEVII